MTIPPITADTSKDQQRRINAAQALHDAATVVEKYRKDSGKMLIHQLLSLAGEIAEGR